MQCLAVQDLLAEMLRTAEAAADRERHGGASAGEVSIRRGSMAADVCRQVFRLAELGWCSCFSRELHVGA